MPCYERLLRGIVAVTSNDSAAFVHGLDCPLVGWSQRNERSFVMNHTDGMMNHTDGWMSGWTGGGTWIWAAIGVAVVVLLVVVIYKLFKK
jgi:hypothetical protein